MSNYNDNDDVNDSDINQLMFIDTESTNFTEGGGGEGGEGNGEGHGYGERQISGESNVSSNSTSSSSSNSGINMNLKTTLSTDKPVFDVNDKYLPHGNYYFTIRTFTERNTAIGKIKIANESHTYEFKNYTIIRLMAKSQSRLCRRAGIDHIDMPRYGSPSNSPSVLRNIVLDSPRRSPRIRARVSPKIEEHKQMNRGAHSVTNTQTNTYTNSSNLGVQTRSMSESSDELISNCSICIDEISIDKVARLPCGHYFHKKCIRSWEKTQKRARKPFDCPNCKAIV